VILTHLITTNSRIWYFDTEDGRNTGRNMLVKISQ